MPVPSGSDQPAGHALIVCARDLGLRGKPGDPPFDMLSRGDTFTVTRQVGIWSYGTAGDGKQGWVLTQYLAKNC